MQSQPRFHAEQCSRVIHALEPCKPAVIYLFGSFGTGSQHPGSDIDLAFLPTHATDPFECLQIANLLADLRVFLRALPASAFLFLFYFDVGRSMFDVQCSLPHPHRPGIPSLCGLRALAVNSPQRWRALAGERTPKERESPAQLKTSRLSFDFPFPTL